MAYNDPKTAHSHDNFAERGPRSTGSVGIGLAVGALIVVALVLLWMFSGTGGPTTDSAGEPAVNMEGTSESTLNPNPATDQSAPAETAPEAAPAPADGAAVGD